MNATALAISIGTLLWANASLLSEEPIPKAEESSGSLDGLAFWLETIDGGYLFSIHRHQGAWSVISGASSDGERWTTKVIEAAEFNDSGALVFDHSPGLHLEKPISLPVKEFQLLSQEGHEPKVYADDIRLSAQFLAKPKVAIFAARSLEDAIHAARFTLGSEYRERPSSVEQSDSYWRLTFELDPDEAFTPDPGIILKVHKQTGLVELRLAP